MNDTIQTARDDLSFLRGLAEDGPAALARDGALLVTVGAIFSVVTFFYFLTFSGAVTVPVAVEQSAWIAGVVVMMASGPFIRRRFPNARSAASRAVRAGMAGVGIGVTVAGLGFILAAWRLGQPHFTLQAFPVAMFTLYGAAWMVAYAARRRLWMGWVAAGCFIVALALGVFAGAPAMWLIMSAALLFLVAVPGWAMMKGRA